MLDIDGMKDITSEGDMWAEILTLVGQGMGWSIGGGEWVMQERSDKFT